MFTLYVLLSCVLICIIKLLLDRRDFNSKLEYIKGPKTLPILGNLLDFLSPTVILPNLLKHQNDFGNLYKIRLGPIWSYVVISDPNFLEFFFTSSKMVEKSRDYGFFKRWLRNGLITAPGHIWKSKRKIVTPAFHFKILEKMVQQFPQANKTLIEKLSATCKTGPANVDVYPFITLCSLDVIHETAMGVSVNAQKNSNSVYVKSTRDMAQIISRRIFSVYKQFEFLYQFSSDYKTEKVALEVLQGATTHVIKERRKELDPNSGTKNTDDFGIREKRAFLDLLLEYKVDGVTLTDEEIQEEVNTIMFAGHDTTASAISFALYCLSRHPEIQDKVYNEIIKILGEDKSKAPNYNDLQEMKYLEMVIKETLRLYPSVHLIARSVIEDVEYKGIFLPKGVFATVCPYTLHRDPEVFPDPEKFDPERFSAQNQTKRNPYSYVPFSAGFRNCIGQKFAMLSMKSMISSVLRNFKLLPGEPAVLVSAEVILKSGNGMHVQIKSRK